MFIIFDNVCINSNIIKTVYTDEYIDDNTKYLIICETEDKNYVMTYKNKKDRDRNFDDLCSNLCF